MIKNIIFDMGQVLIHFDPDYFIKRSNISNKDDISLLKKEIYKSIEWPKMDRGVLKEEEACRLMCERLPKRLHDVAYELVCKWPYPLIEVKGAKEIVEKLKENGYKLYLLSNASYMQKEYWQNVSCHDLFDGVVVSAYEGCVKPEAKIYQILLDRYHLNANETIFIDDSPINCEACDNLGIKSIVFHGEYDEVIKKFKELGINI